MVTTQDMLKGTNLTVEGIRQDMQTLKLYYDDLDMESRVLPPMVDAPLPTLIAVLDVDDQERVRIVNHSILPLDGEDARYTKFLQFYAELDTPAHTLDRAQLLEACLRLNSILPLGTVILADARPELELKICLRHTQGYPLKEDIDQGTFSETVFLFDLSCAFVTAVMDAMAEGKDLQEAVNGIGA